MAKTNFWIGNWILEHFCCAKKKNNAPKRFFDKMFHSDSNENLSKRSDSEHEFKEVISVSSVSLNIPENTPNVEECNNNEKIVDKKETNYPYIETTNSRIIYVKPASETFVEPVAKRMRKSVGFNVYDFREVR